MRSGGRRSRRGNAAVVALSLTALLGFGALAVDMAWVRVHALQLQVALDAGALAGAGHIDGTWEGVDLAVAAAVEVANANNVSSGMTLGPEHVVLGDWDPDAETFTPNADWTEDGAKTIDAVRLSLTLDDIPSFLSAAVYGVTSLSTAASSVGYRPLQRSASEVPCWLPIALPSCAFPAKPEANPAPQMINMGDNLNDTVGWAIPGGVNAADVVAQIKDGCGGGALQEGDPIAVQNGVVMKAVQTIADKLNGKFGAPDTWSTEELGSVPTRGDPSVSYPVGVSLVKGDNWGNIYQGAVALVDIGGEPGTCAGAEAFNGTPAIQGFTWGVLYDARKGDASSAGFWLQLDFVTPRELGTETTASALGNVVGPGGEVQLVD